jgi:hypothetical protein
MLVCISFYAWLNYNMICILYTITINLYTLLERVLPHNYIHG